MDLVAKNPGFTGSKKISLSMFYFNVTSIFFAVNSKLNFNSSKNQGTPIDIFESFV